MPAGRDINFKVAAILFSGSTFRNGDWLRETLSAVFSVSSNTASPVLLAKSARTMVALSVREVAGLVERERKYSAPPIAAATSITPAGTKPFRSSLPATATFTALDDPAGACAAVEPDAGNGDWEIVGCVTPAP